MKNFRKVCRGEKGFTLIELLVVIMILGVLAAVVTLAVTKFIGKGTVESANAEAVTVQAAVESCLGDANYGQFVAASYTWTGDNASSPVTSNGYRAYDYLRSHNFKATYTISRDGFITGATDVSWGNLTFDAATQKWHK